MRKKLNINNKKYILIIFIITLLMSVGYASINSVSLDIKGNSFAKSQEGIFITDVIYTNDDIDTNYITNTYYQTVLDGSVTLEKNEMNSTVTFKVNVYNSTNEEYAFRGIEYATDLGDEFINVYDNESIEYTYDNLNKIIKPGQTMTITTTFKYKSEEELTENLLNFIINYKFDNDTWEGITRYGFSQSQILGSQDQKFLSLNFTNVGGQYEKINLPLNNLQNGSLYQLTFTVELINSGIIEGTTKSSKSLVFGNTVMSSPNTNYTSSKNLIYYDGFHSNWMWKSNSDEKQTDTITFKATSSTMYWVWDLSKVSDINSIININIDNLELTPKPSSPYIDVPNTTLFQKDFSDVTDDTTYVPTGHQGTFIQMTSYDKLIARIEAAGGFEFINIPIVGLTSGKSYTISFDNYTETTKSSWKYGAQVQATKQESGGQLVDDNDFLINDFSIVNSGEITFSATASTMYFVWDCGGLSDGKWARVTVSNMKLKQN